MTAAQRGNVKGEDGIEVHHILPKAFGGSNSKNNLVGLTLREHYICHVLLTKFTKNVDKSKMCYALHVFFHFTAHRNAIYSVNSRQYEYHRRRYVQSMRDRIAPNNTTRFTFKHQITGEVFNGTRQEFKNYSKLTDQYISALINHYQKSAKGWGVLFEENNMFSFEQKRKITKLQPIVCKYCEKSTSPMNHKKWHGENCKYHNPEKFAKQAEQITNLQKIRHSKINP